MRVGIYCRLSDEDRDKDNPANDSESIQNQKSMLLRYAMEQGWDVYDLYCDEDYAGSDRTRPGFNRLLDDAEKGRFHIVLCKTQARFSRELEIVEKYIHGLFPLWGVRFIGLVDNADTSVKGNKKSRQINGLVNEWFLEDLSENVRSAFDIKRKQGQFIGSFAPYGYQKASDDKNKLVVDEPAARVVRRIFREYRAGHGLKRIAGDLSDEGIPNPTWYKKANGYPVMSKRRGAIQNFWSVTTVRGILRNPVYIGTLVQGRQQKVSYKSDKLTRTPAERWYVTENNHEPIVDSDTWKVVQECFAGRQKMRKTGTVHVFAGKSRCLYCGLGLRVATSRGVKYLRCPKSQVSTKQCVGARIALPVLEEQVLAELNELASRYYDEALLCDRVTIENSAERQLRSVKDEMAAAERREEELTRAGMNLYLDKVKGVISEEKFLELSRAVDREQQTARANRHTLEKEKERLQESMQNAKSKRDLIREHRQFDRLTRELVVEFIERVDVGRKDWETGAVPVHIAWKV